MLSWAQMKKTKLDAAKEVFGLLRKSGELEIQASDLLRAAVRGEADIDQSIDEACYLLLEAQLLRRELMEHLDAWN